MSVEEICERLERERFSGRFAMGGGTVSSDGGPGDSWGGERIMERVNPDGPEAAALIRAQQARIGALEAGVERLGGLQAFTLSRMLNAIADDELIARINFARTLLTAEKIDSAHQREGTR